MTTNEIHQCRIIGFLKLPSNDPFRSSVQNNVANKCYIIIIIIIIIMSLVTGLFFLVILLNQQ